MEKTIDKMDLINRQVDYLYEKDKEYAHIIDMCGKDNISELVYCQLSYNEIKKEVNYTISTLINFTINSLSKYIEASIKEELYVKKESDIKKNNCINRIFLLFCLEDELKELESFNIDIEYVFEMLCKLLKCHEEHELEALYNELLSNDSLKYDDLLNSDTFKAIRCKAKILIMNILEQERKGEEELLKPYEVAAIKLSPKEQYIKRIDYKRNSLSSFDNT